MIRQARTRCALQALRAAVDAGEYGRATLLMESYDQHLRELAAVTETARASLQALLDEQFLVITQFAAMRDQARSGLVRLNHIGPAARTHLH